jgi:hypothetical protein
MADDQEFIGSHEKAKNAYGQNGYQGASSLTPGQTKPPIADVSPKQASVPSLATADTLAVRVKMDGDGKAAAITSHSGMPARGVSSGSPGGQVPASNLRRDSGKNLLR